MTPVLQLDYSKKLLVVDLSPEEQLKALEDFSLNLVNLLTEMGVNPYYQRSISLSLLYTHMSDKVAYHNPIHPLSLLYFAQQHAITLEPWEQLAIFFHDAIYKPNGKSNEENSAQYMTALLHNSGVSFDTLFKTSYAIRATALHKEEHVESEFELLLDLDCSVLGADKETFRLYDKGIYLEYIRTDVDNYGSMDEKTYLDGRIKFLKDMLNKKNIYRTPYIRNLLEDRARTNLSELIVDLEKLQKNV